jgi:hypothetical protein
VAKGLKKVSFIAEQEKAYWAIDNRDNNAIDIKTLVNVFLPLSDKCFQGSLMVETKGAESSTYAVSHDFLTPTASWRQHFSRYSKALILEVTASKQLKNLGKSVHDRILGRTIFYLRSQEAQTDLPPLPFFSKHLIYALVNKLEDPEAQAGMIHVC